MRTLLVTSLALVGVIGIGMVTGFISYDKGSNRIVIGELTEDEKEVNKSDVAVVKEVKETKPVIKTGFESRQNWLVDSQATI